VTAAATVPEVAPPDRSARGWLLAVGFAVLPIVVALVRALTGHWVPVGDDAYFVIRARDVFSSHFPLLGTWTSASLTAGRDINNPGPLYFDVLAVPVRLLGGSAGVAVGAALVNVAAILGIAATAFRRGGPVVGALAMLVTGMLAWSMGSLLLFDPWQPHALLLPFLCFLFLAWALACGDLVLLPWAVGLGSLLAQTHLTYVVLVGAAGVVGAAGLVLDARRRRNDPDAPPRRVGPTLGVAAGVAVVCWLPPIVEQLFRAGNLSALAASSSGDAPVLGARRGLQVMAKVLTLPPFWSRSGFSHSLAPSPAGPHSGPGGVGLDQLPGLPAAVVSLAILVVLLGAVVAWRWRAGDRPGGWAAVVALVALGAGVVTAVRIPIEIFGVAAHQLRWLWPLGAFALFALVTPAVQAWAARSAPARARGVVGMLVGLGLVVAVANLPTHDAGAGPAGDRYALPGVRALDRQLARAHLRGPLLVDVSDITFGEPYNAPMMAALQRAGVPFVVTDRTQVRQLGPGRQARPGEARARIYDVVGGRAATVPPGARRVAFHPGLDRAERAELARLRPVVAADVRSGRIGLNAEGRALAARGVFAWPADAAADPTAPVRDGALAAAEGVGGLAVDPAVAVRVARYVELQRRWDRETVGVFVAPLRG
jgi:hypothetical protein